MTVGVVLCGGPGTRLRPLTYYFQKVMVPVGRRQKPLLEYVIRSMKFHGIVDIALLVNYKAEQIANYFEDGSRFGVRISYSHDDPNLIGTAGSIFNAYKNGVIDADETLLIYYGDILSNLDLGGLVRFHLERGATATLALASGFPVRVGIAELDDDGRVLGFVEKPVVKRPVSIGVAVLDGRVVGKLGGLIKGRRLDLMGDVIPYLIREGEPVYGYLTDAFWYDVGSVEAYEKLDHELVDELFSYLFEEKG